MHLTQPPKRRRWWLAAAGLPLAALATLWAAFQIRPSLPLYPAPPAAASALRVTWLGVSTLLFDDGKTAWMTDGFFSRPGVLRTGLGHVQPEWPAIRAALAKSGVERLAGVVVLHSHYDHALDAPVVAKVSGARLIGSASTAQIGRGQGLAEPAIVVVPDAGGSVQLGEFQLQLIASAHAPEDHFPGQITAPLVPPSRASAYKTGAAYSLLVTHHGKRVLVQASAGFVAGALRGVQADTVLLGIGLMGKQDAGFRQRYWQEVVGGTGAKRVLPIHWDDFFIPLDQGRLAPLPWIADRIPKSLAFVDSQCAQGNCRMELPQAFIPFDPFQ
jgi:L-ascorbate metabolism protein UlaG (beta-lactamase superfamily)